MNTQKPTRSYEIMLALFAVLPSAKIRNEQDVKLAAEVAMSQEGFDEQTYRINLDLSDAQLSAWHHTHRDAKGVSIPLVPRDWWIQEYRLGESVANTLDLVVYFEDDTNTGRIIGTDSVTRRVLAENGKVYQLARRLVSPIEVSVQVERQHRPEKLTISADRFADDDELAKKYVIYRHTEAVQFFKSLTWTPCMARGFSVQTQVYGVQIVHEMAESQLHAGPVWGELFFINQEGRDPIIFPTFENFVAYMLAKYW